MNTEKTRAALAIMALAALIGAAVRAFFVGGKLSGVAITLLTMLCTQLSGEVKTAFSYFFDGTPKAPATGATPAGAPAATTFPDIEKPNGGTP